MAGAGAGEVAGVVCGSQGGARWSEDAETVVETAALAAASIQGMAAARLLLLFTATYKVVVAVGESWSC